MANARQTTVVRFGVYELDLAARQLRKNGARIKLQDQPFRVLQLLTERPGEIVTREELREKLWPADTFVEFDHSLNTTIQKIRQALGDSPNVPRYVETIPRTGYRFVAPVEAARAQPLPPEPKPAPLGTSLGLTVGALGVLAALAGWWIIRSPEPAFEHTSDRPLRRLTSDQGLAYQPALSSDGKLLAYASDRGGEGNLDIWVQQIGAGAPARLTTDEADETEPSFSPDAARIVFRSGRDGGGIYSVPTLGGEQPRLIAPHGRRPRYSPDGNWIAYWVGSEHLAVGFVYLIGAAGGNPGNWPPGAHPSGRPIAGTCSLQEGEQRFRTIGTSYPSTGVIPSPPALSSRSSSNTFAPRWKKSSSRKPGIQAETRWCFRRVGVTARIFGGFRSHPRAGKSRGRQAV